MSPLNGQIKLISRDIPKSTGNIAQLGILPSHGYRPIADQHGQNKVMHVGKWCAPGMEALSCRDLQRKTLQKFVRARGLPTEHIFFR